jgi:hypothetical protein
LKKWRVESMGSLRGFEVLEKVKVPEVVLLGEGEVKNEGAARERLPVGERET